MHLSRLRLLFVQQHYLEQQNAVGLVLLMTHDQNFFFWFLLAKYRHER